MPVAIGRNTGGFAVAGKPATVAAKRRLLERWIERAVGFEDAGFPGSWHWTDLAARIEAYLRPRGWLGAQVRALYTVDTDELDEDKALATRRKFVKALRARGAKLDADLDGSDEPAAPAGALDEAALALHCDVSGSIKKHRGEGHPERALEVALYPSLFLTAWHAMPSEIAALVTLPLRWGDGETLAALGASERLTPQNARATVTRAVAAARKRYPKLRFDAGRVECTDPLAFATSFVAELGRLKLGAGTGRRAALIPRAEPQPPASPFSTANGKRPSRKLPRENPFDDELRKDHDFILARALEHHRLDGEDAPEAIAEAVHQLIAAVQQGKRKLSKQQVVDLAVLWGEQLVRALGWQWTRVVYRDGDAGAVAVVSPDRALAHVPFGFLSSLARKGARDNTVALTFNMFRAGMAPPGTRPRAYTPVG